MNDTKTEIQAQAMGVRAQAMGVITSPPEFKRNLTGTPVCRFEVTAPTGPASEPIVKPVYVWGLRDGEPDAEMAHLAERCGKGLRIGDRVLVPGVERQRTGKSGIEHAIIADAVQLKERGVDLGAAA